MALGWGGPTKLSGEKVDVGLRLKDDGIGCVGSEQMVSQREGVA